MISARPPLTADTFESCEDRIVLALIGFVGALGIAIGLCDPARTVEPSLGLVMLLFAARIFVRGVWDRRRAQGGQS